MSHHKYDDRLLYTHGQRQFSSALGSPSSVTLKFKYFQGPFQGFYGPSYDNYAHSERYSTSSTPLVYM